MSSTQPLADRTEAVYRELKSLRRRFRVGSWITLIVGGLLLLLVAVYFSYGYSEISSLRDPDLIVSLLGNTVDEQIPALRQQLEGEVNNNASAWAEQASQQALAAIPALREQIEQLALQQSDTIIAKIDVVGEQQFRRILDENRLTMENAIKDLKNNEQMSKEVVLALQLAIEKELQIDAKNQADAIVTMLSDLNANMGKLMDGKNLTREQKAERRVIMLAKRLQVVRFGDVKLDELSLPPVVESIIIKHEEDRLREAAKPTAESKDAPAAKKPAAKKPAAKPEEAAKPAPKATEKKDAPTA